MTRRMWGSFLVDIVGTLIMVVGALNLFAPDGPPDLLLIENHNLGVATFVVGIGLQIAGALSFRSAALRASAERDAEDPLVG